MYSDRNPPKQCPNGYQLGPNRMLVGWDNIHDPRCRCWTCLECDAVIHSHTARWLPIATPRGLDYVPKSAD